MDGMVGREGKQIETQAFRADLTLSLSCRAARAGRQTWGSLTALISGCVGIK